MKHKIFKIPVIKGKVLGVSVYRGYAPLNLISQISKADIYDQKNNPTGTQRDLSPKHAREAYEYVRNKDFAFWPEVFLCVRNRNVISYKNFNDVHTDFGNLIIDLNIAKTRKKIAISRIDGNHRLHYADGSDKKFPPISKTVSFCLAYNITREEEIKLFKDINNNQKRMNTSHLDNIESRLTPEEELKKTQPELYISQQLGNDTKSPLYDKIYEGGKKQVGYIIPLRTMKSGIKYLLSRATKLKQLPDIDAQYKVIVNYFKAVKKWIPQAWNEPKKYLALRGAGLWSICYIGADVIERVLSDGKFTVKDMTKTLNSGRKWDWSNKGDFQGLGGAGGALQISDKVTSEFQDESSISIRDLYSEIMKTN